MATLRPVRAREQLFVSGAVLAACLLLAAPAGATLRYFSASIDGAQETPPNGSPGMASGTFTMDTNANTLSYNIVITVATPTAENNAHIHGFAAPGVPAGILHPLPLGTPKVGVWNYGASVSDENNIIAGLTYVNIHTVANPGGEIRGQILQTGFCGDGIIQGGNGEACDDLNSTSGDGCSDTCQVENCFTCAGAPSSCSPITMCINADGCCPGGCNSGNDSDCAAPVPAMTPPGTMLLGLLLTLTMAWVLLRRVRTS